jgi:outer membrane protein
MISTYRTTPFFKPRFSALALSAVFALSAGTAGAGEWIVGGNLLGGNNPYEDGDNVGGLLPVVAYRGERFHANLGNPGISFFRGTSDFGGLGYSVYIGDSFQIDLVGQLRMIGLDPDKEDAWRGLDERKAGFDAGVSLLWQTGVGEFDLQLLTDVSNRSDGQEVLLSYAYPITQGAWTLRPEVGVSWQSSDLNDYYFGVDADEARAGRAAYEADAGVTPFVGVELEYAVSTQTHLIGGFGYGRLGDEISDSPIVDARSVGGAYLGLTYTF